MNFSFSTLSSALLSKTLYLKCQGFLLLTLLSFNAFASIEFEPWEYEVDGHAMKGYVAWNSQLEQSRGTVLIVHDWNGPDDYEQFRARQLAAMGYTAFAIDVYGRDRQPTSMQENQQRAGEMYADRELFRSRLMGAVDEASRIPAATDHMVVMGYCFGGAAVLEMARAGAPLNGFVSFHGGLDLPEGQDYQNVQAPVLLLHGSADPVSDMQDLAALLDQLQESGVEHNAHVYGGALHSFTVYSSGDYDLRADQASWAALTAFLEQQL